MAMNPAGGPPPPVPYYETDPNIAPQAGAGGVYQPQPPITPPITPPVYDYGATTPAYPAYPTAYPSYTADPYAVEYPPAVTTPSYAYGATAYNTPYAGNNSPYVQQQIVQQEFRRPSSTSLPTRRVSQRPRPRQQQQSKTQQTKTQQTKTQQTKTPFPGVTFNVKRVTVKTESDPVTIGGTTPKSKQQQARSRPVVVPARQQQQQSQRQQQTKTLQTKQVYPENTRNRPVDVQKLKLSRWSFSTASDPSFYLDGEKVMIISEKALPRNHHMLQYRVPENYSDKAIVVRRQKGGKEILEIYYLNIFDPNGNRVYLRTDVIMPTS